MTSISMIENFIVCDFVHFIQIARQLAQQLMPNIFPDRDEAYEARQAELERLRLERIAMAEIRQRQVALRLAQPDFSNFKVAGVLRLFVVIIDLTWLLLF